MIGQEFHAQEHQYFAQPCNALENLADFVIADLVALDQHVDGINQRRDVFIDQLEAFAQGGFAREPDLDGAVLRFHLPRRLRIHCVPLANERKAQ